MIETKHAKYDESIYQLLIEAMRLKKRVEELLIANHEVRSAYGITILQVARTTNEAVLKTPPNEWNMMMVRFVCHDDAQEEKKGDEPLASGTDVP